MTAPTPRTAFLVGLRNSAPFLLVIAPFATLFGVVGTEAGLNIVEVMGFAVLVIAGAAQFTVVQQMRDDARTVIVIISAVAVDLRMAMYSASLVPHLGKASLWKRVICASLMLDQNYALSITRFESRPALDLQEKIAFYLSAVPITFLAMLAPALRTVAHVAAAFVSLILGLALSFVPFNLGLLIAAMAAILTGAEVERRMTRGLAG